MDDYFSSFKSSYHGLCVSIENVEILAQAKKKQFFLYSILEWVKISTFPILFVGITSDLRLMDVLEKRVKSRFIIQLNT